MENIRFGILGGDNRYKFLYEMLERENVFTKIFNNSFAGYLEKDLETLLNEIDVLIAPIPFTKDSKTVFCPDFKEIVIKDLIEKMKKFNVKYLMGGVIPKDAEDLALKNGIKVFDFFKEETVSVLNAIPTAEGAIQIAIKESEKTLFGSKVLVLGYGRCGKILSNMLKGIGALVSVSHRRKEEFSYIQAYGLEPLKIQDLKSKIHQFDFIFNTVPSCILNEDTLKEVRQKSLIIDLAQAPGGVDYKCARDLNLKALYCPGLPGRFAPYTSAEILKNCIYEYCNEKLKNN